MRVSGIEVFTVSYTTLRTQTERMPEEVAQAAVMEGYMNTLSMLRAGARERRQQLVSEAKAKVEEEAANAGLNVDEARLRSESETSQITTWWKTGWLRPRA